MSCNTQELSRFGIVDTFFCWQKMCVAPDFEVRSLSEPCEKRVQSVKAVGKSAGGPRVFTRKRACRLRRIINLLFFWVVHPLMTSPCPGCSRSSQAFFRARAGVFRFIRSTCTSVCHQSDVWPNPDGRPVGTSKSAEQFYLCSIYMYG